MKLKLLDETAAIDQTALYKELLTNPCPKILGDNLNIFIRGFLERVSLDLFTSLAVFPRIPYQHLSCQLPVPPPFTPNTFMIGGDDARILQQSYMVLIGRIASQSLDAFRHFSAIIPRHIPHAYSDHMAQKSKVFGLPIMMKNEAKYDDCLDILDMYEEQLISLHTEVFGKCLSLCSILLERLIPYCIA